MLLVFINIYINRPDVKTYSDLFLSVPHQLLPVVVVVRFTYYRSIKYGLSEWVYIYGAWFVCVLCICTPRLPASVCAPLALIMNALLAYNLSERERD